MKRLIIDTSSEQCIVALFEHKRLLSHVLFAHENRLSQTLLPAIQAELHAAHLSLKEIDSIAVGVGPGSYTGTRVGVAVAKSLAFGLSIPLRGFCSLIAFLPERMGHFASVLAAKSGLFYVLKGKRESQSICIEQAGLLAPSELPAALSSVDFIATKEELPVTKPLFTFEAHPENIVLCLETPAQFPFEKEAEMIYLNHV